MSSVTMTPLVDLMKALAHPMRLRILALLREGELCVCQIVQVLGVATSTTSEHLTELRKVGLLTERKEGRWVYYGLSSHPDLEALLQGLWPLLDRVDQVGQDGEAARVTRRIPVAVTCSTDNACASRNGKGRRRAG